MSRRAWTVEEVEYLKDRWGLSPLPNIAKKLDRTECAVRNKIYKLDMGGFFDNSDCITMHKLLSELGYSTNHTYALTSWIEKRNFPVRYRRIKNKRYKIVALDEFWVWAEENQSFLDFSKLEKYSLGPEPTWVDEKRKRDIKNKRQFKKNQKEKWTEKEYEYLQFLVNQHKYTYSEIAKKIGRTENAVARKLWQKGIKARPIQAGNNKEWSKQQIDKLKELILDNYDYEHITEQLKPKTLRAIKSKTSRLYGTQNLDCIRKQFKEEY